MSGSKHTPGPWTFTYNNWEVSSVYGPDDCLIAEVQIHPSVTEENQHELESVKEDNARLIAAAPDLLEALKAIHLQALQSNVNSPANEWGREALEMASAAIAKAEGRA